jgi:copper chaperone NosL
MRWIAILLLLAACKEELVATPDPVAMTDEALGYFCQMNVSEHHGPKGQIHLASAPQPLFFAQVRDVVAYLKGPERQAEISAVYVSDMGATQSWAEPGITNWIDARAAFFVVGAGVRGGMGAPEIVPFATSESAKTFTERYGGTVMSLDEIPDDAAIGPIDLDQSLEDPE